MNEILEDLGDFFENLLEDIQTAHSNLTDIRSSVVESMEDLEQLKFNVDELWLQVQRGFEELQELQQGKEDE